MSDAGMSPDEPDARRLTGEADWDAIARWCGGMVEVTAGERALRTAVGDATEGSWIVATPGGLFSHAVYADRDYRGFLALMAGRHLAANVSDRRGVLEAHVLAAMAAAGTGVSAVDLEVLADAAVAALWPELSAGARAA